jgi:hypothetical protein
MLQRERTPHVAKSNSSAVIPHIHHCTRPFSFRPAFLPSFQIKLNSTTVENVFTVGNGEMGFTTDLTGLQSMNAS